MQLVEPGATSFIGPELVPSFLSAFLIAPEQKDVLRKLARSGRANREVFIWIDRHQFGPWQSLCNGELPEGDLELPEEVTGVWVAGTCFNGRREVWRFSGGSWTQVESSSDVGNGSN